MIAILKKELKAYFYSPIGYIFIGFFLLISGYFFVSYNLNPMYGSTNMSPIFSNLTVIFLFIIPILTMKLFSEERKNKTDQLLITSPVNLSGIVLGKFLSALSVFVIALLITGIYPIILSFFGKLAYGEVFGAYLGFFLLGATFIAVGIFISSLTENQVIAAVSSFGVLLLLWLLDWITSAIQNQIIIKIIGWLSVVNRFNDFSIGVLNLSSVIYYLSFCSVFIFLTIRVLEKRRWS